ncbi:MAG: hypothetical protein H6922_02125 [Pseudomonadaceae bacterium]|nr:hypothetical protein [Pseudomonadaceae bacterium]
MRHALALLASFAALPAHAANVYWYQAPHGTVEVYEQRLTRYEAPPVGWRSASIWTPDRHHGWMPDTVPPFYRSNTTQSHTGGPVTVYTRTIRHVYTNDDSWNTARFWNDYYAENTSPPTRNPAPRIKAKRKPVNLDTTNLPYCK